MRSVLVLSMVLFLAESGLAAAKQEKRPIPNAKTLKEAATWDYKTTALWIGDFTITRGKKGTFTEDWQHRVSVGVRNKTARRRVVVVYVSLFTATGQLVVACTLKTDEALRIDTIGGRESRTFAAAFICKSSDIDLIRYAVIRVVDMGPVKEK